MEKKYNNAAEEAHRLGVTKGWLWKKARERKIPCAKIGKYYFFNPAEIDKWIQNAPGLRVEDMKNE